MPPAMLAAIVLSANHYLLDGMAGGGVALLAAARLAGRPTAIPPNGPDDRGPSPLLPPPPRACPEGIQPHRPARSER